MTVSKLGNGDTIVAVPPFLTMTVVIGNFAVPFL